MRLPFSQPHGISIHTPHAGSDYDFNKKRWYVHISIHTPHAGSDKVGAKFSFGGFVFQSTLPMRGVTKVARTAKEREIIFQSTLPMRGVTLPDDLQRQPHVISIHTPHAGSDLQNLPPG